MSFQSLKRPQKGIFNLAKRSVDADRHALAGQIVGVPSRLLMVVVSPTAPSSAILSRKACAASLWAKARKGIKAAAAAHMAVCGKEPK